MSKKTVGSKYEYEMKDKLGSGAFAEVFKGKNKSTGEIVAIKVIKRSLLAKYGDDILKQIHQEVSILQQLVVAMKGQICPYINKIFECMETTNNIYIVLEFCNQGTLLDQVKKTKKLPEDQAVFIVFQLVQALSFLTDNNIAHRDIKPENVFIKDGIYKLGDFGFAGQKSLYQTHLGTYPYMAPEFFNSNQYDGNQVDIWAMGLLFHEILFGEIYFIGNSQYEVSQKIVNKPYVLDGKYQVSAEVKDLLPRMVEKDRNKRITAKQILEHPLFNKFKTDPRYLQIMETEQKYMEQFNKQDESPTQLLQQQQIQQQNEEERQRLEEENKQKRLQEELSRQQEEFKQNYAIQLGLIKEAINYMRNGITLFVQLCEFLQQNFIEVCRYDIFYILKQSLIQIHKIKEQLNDQYHFTIKDNVKFGEVKEEFWVFFYQDRNTTQLLEDIEQDKNVIRKSYIDYFNYINNYTAANYGDHLFNLQTVTNLELQKPVDPQLYNSQLNSTMDFFKSELSKVQDLQIQQIIRKSLIWLYVAAYQDQVIAGKMLDISKFMVCAESNNIEGMKQLLKMQ